jgi:hypothetical protein
VTREDNHFQQTELLLPNPLSISALGDFAFVEKFRPVRAAA